MACARMGSAVGFSDAAAIGAAPITITPRAAKAVTVCIEVAVQRRARPFGAQQLPPSPARRGSDGLGLDRGCWLTRGVRQPGERQVPGRQQQDGRDHAVRVGAEAAEKAEVLDQHPVGETQHARRQYRDAD